MTRAMLAILLTASAGATAQDAKPVDAATAFGSRRSAGYVTLSPDGNSLAFVGPVSGTGTALYTYDFNKDAAPKVALYSDGKPERIEYCNWVANQRLACLIGQIVDDGQKLLPVTRWVALDRDGTALKLLSNPSNLYTNGYQLWGGTIIDFLPDQDGAILMARKYIPDTHTGSHIGSMLSGLGVDWIDSRTLQTRSVETPGDSVIAYIADGHGQVRVMGQEETKAAAGGRTGQIRYSYRKPGSKEWSPLAEYNRRDRSGFAPVDIDADTDTVYGDRILDGRNAIYSMALDGTLTEKLVSSRPDVDVLGVVRGNRHRHIVGVFFQTDTFRTLYFDPAYQRITSMLARALPQESSINIVDGSDDGNKFLILTSGDDDPGHYYLFTRDSRQLRPLLAAYMALDGYHLAKTRTIGYTATDSSPISGYLTLPQGASEAKGLPAIVLLVGNSSTISGGWIAQYFAARGFAVLQANIRGMAGYGDRLPEHSPFKSWRLPVDDALRAGQWLIDQGIADPAKLSILGRDFGGYIALQSNVVNQSTFKAVIAIDPVTDLSTLKEQFHGWSNFGLMDDYIGNGGELKEASPAHNAAQIKVPVLLFHGALDRTSSIKQSRRMDEALRSAGVKHELVTWPHLDDELDDSEARAELLRKSDAFLRQTIGLPSR